jgi:hypothetical protein
MVGSITICCGIYENRERVDQVEYLILAIEKAIDKKTKMNALAIFFQHQRRVWTPVLSLLLATTAMRSIP